MANEYEENYEEETFEGVVEKKKGFFGRFKEDHPTVFTVAVAFVTAFVSGFIGYEIGTHLEVVEDEEEAIDGIATTEDGNGEVQVTEF